ncbi:hypothetical protein DFR76_102858 [Nocardia pseudobrasiliensis]|uniref:Uncharacterized protein n=1 Tax=Nocardia pseudobrasiliensis TaxID=45979 RepID=A0A370ICK4_9NOCA|nr:hypothetical protein DFR76_102858 [Nocardia pseudobrasiliensis]
MHAHRHVRAGFAGKCGFSVDFGRPAPCIALGHLPDTQQCVRPGAQHQFLQRPGLRPVTVPRRLKDPAPQPRYVLLMDTPIDGVPHQPVLGSVHRDGVQLAPSVRDVPRAPALSRLTSPRQRSFEPSHQDLVSDRFPRPPPEQQSPASEPRRLSAIGICLLGFLFPPRGCAPLTIEVHRFRAIYNTIRPHQALGDRTPVTAYTEHNQRKAGE